MALFACDTQLRTAMGFLADPLQAFYNPISSRIGNLQSLGWDAKTRLTNELLNPVKPNNVTQEEWDARLAAMGNLHNTFNNIFASPSGFANSKMGELQSYTDFMSGRHGIASPFPANVLSGSAANAVGVGLLAGATFMTVLGVASGANTFNSRQCDNGTNGSPLADLPSIPVPEACKNSTSIFGMVLGLYNGALDALGSIMGAVVGFLDQTAANLAQLQQTINNAVSAIMEKIVNEITKLAKLITEALAEAAAKLLKNLAADPCTAAILSQILNPLLASAINMPDTSANLIPSLGIPSYL